MKKKDVLDLALKSLEQSNAKAKENEEVLKKFKFKGAEIVKENGKTIAVFDGKKMQIDLDEKSSNELVDRQTGGNAFGIDIPYKCIIAGKELGFDTVRFIGQKFNDRHYYNIEADINIEFVDCDMTTGGFKGSVQGENVAFINSKANIYYLSSKGNMLIKDSEITASRGIEVKGEKTEIIDSYVKYAGESSHYEFGGQRERGGIFFKDGKGKTSGVVIENSKIDAGEGILDIYGSNPKIDEKSEIMTDEAIINKETINFNANKQIKTFFEQEV